MNCPETRSRPTLWPVVGFSWRAQIACNRASSTKPINDTRPKGMIGLRNHTLLQFRQRSRLKKLCLGALNLQYSCQSCTCKFLDPCSCQAHVASSHQTASRLQVPVKTTNDGTKPSHLELKLLSVTQRISTSSKSNLNCHRRTKGAKHLTLQVAVQLLARPTCLVANFWLQLEGANMKGSCLQHGSTRRMKQNSASKPHFPHMMTRPHQPCSNFCHP